MSDIRRFQLTCECEKWRYYQHAHGAWVKIDDHTAEIARLTADNAALRAEVEMVRGAIADIAAERKRQVSREGWSHEHDDEHDLEELARAAACYAMPQIWRDIRKRKFFIAGNTRSSPSHYFAEVPSKWPLDPEYWKPSENDRRRELVKAGALIVAEIERLDRFALAPAPQAPVIECSCYETDHGHQQGCPMKPMPAPQAQEKHDDQ